MKKIKMFAVAAMFCAAGFAGYTSYDKATMTDQEKMILANIEALTNDEIIRVECDLLLYNVHETRINGSLQDWYCTKDGGNACKRPSND